MVGELVCALGHTLVGYIDRDEGRLGRGVGPLGVPVTCTEVDFLAGLRERGEYPMGVDACALGIGENVTRQECLKGLGDLQVPALVHPSATVSPSVEIGRGTVVFPHAVINVGTRVGEAVIINSGCIIEHDCVLESAVHVSPGVILCGGVRVGERSWIGAGATAIHGITIGKGAIVGAGSTVIRDVSDRDTVIGSPAVSKEAK